jgi:biotin operon repressor
MKTDTSDRILNFLKANEWATPKQLVDFLGFSQVAVQKQLRNLTSHGQIVRMGQSPRVFYGLKKVPIISSSNSAVIIRQSSVDTTSKELNQIPTLSDNDYVYITPTGKFYYGMAGFEQYCLNNQLPFVKTLTEYFKIKEKYDHLKQPNGLIDATAKLGSSFESSFIDKLYYLDFYSYERFGKNFLAQLTFQAKQSQDKSLIDLIARIIEPTINLLIKTQKIDAVAFVPPTVDRKVQFQKELAKKLNLNLPQISIVKAFEDTPVQQKTLKKITDRIENARQTFFVTETRSYWPN